MRAGVVRHAHAVESDDVMPSPGQLPQRHAAHGADTDDSDLLPGLHSLLSPRCGLLLI